MPRPSSRIEPIEPRDADRIEERVRDDRDPAAHLPADPHAPGGDVIDEPLDGEAAEVQRAGLTK